MELWVRSQDKEILLKVSNLKIEDKYFRINPSDDMDSLIYAIYDDKTFLAMYKSKERALEVLDEIQYLLSSPQQHIEEEVIYYMPNDGSSKIYEMPKE